MSVPSFVYYFSDVYISLSLFSTYSPLLSSSYSYILHPSPMPDLFPYSLTHQPSRALLPPSSTYPHIPVLLLLYLNLPSMLLWQLPYLFHYLCKPSVPSKAAFFLSLDVPFFPSSSLALVFLSFPFYFIFFISFENISAVPLQYQTFYRFSFLFGSPFNFHIFCIVKAVQQ